MTAVGRTLVAGGKYRPVAGQGLSPAGRTVPDQPFGRTHALVSGDRAQYGVLCAEGLLWLPGGGSWRAWRLSPEARAWAGRNAPFEQPRFGAAPAGA